MEFTFTCAACGEIHRGMPSFGADKPLSYYEIPVNERAARCTGGTEDCVIDNEWFFVRGCIEIPVLGEQEPFTWGVWVSLGRDSYETWRESYDLERRAQLGPFFGWLNASLKPYPDTANLKTRLHLRDHGLRPFIELEPTDHPLAVEQRNGITGARVAELYAIMMHDQPDC